MNTIELQQTLPAVFAGRDSIISDVWHQSLTLKRGEAYLVEAASGTGKSSLCSYVYGYRNDYQGIICFDGKNIRTLSVRDWVEIRPDLNLRKKSRLGLNSSALPINGIRQ